MRSLIAILLMTTALLTATGLPIAYEAHTTEFIARAPNYAATISAAKARIRAGDVTIRFHAVSASPQLQPGTSLSAHVNYISRSRFPLWNDLPCSAFSCSIEEIRPVPSFGFHRVRSMRRRGHEERRRHRICRAPTRSRSAAL